MKRISILLVLVMLCLSGCGGGGGTQTLLTATDQGMRSDAGTTTSDDAVPQADSSQTETSPAVQSDSNSLDLPPPPPDFGDDDDPPPPPPGFD